MATGTAHGPEDDDPLDGSDEARIGRPDAGLGGASRLPVLTAIADPVLEAQVVGALATPRSRLTVVRRCVDLPDLLAGATTGTARAVLVSADLRRLDQDALARLHRLGLAVVGLNDDAAVAAERAEARLRQLGVSHVVPASSTAPGPADELSVRLGEAVEAAVAAHGSRSATGTAVATAGGRTDRARAVDGSWSVGADADADTAEDTAENAAGDEPLGRLLAVWGPTGAPGRSFLAWNLAGALAAAGRRVLLVDADTYGGTLGQYAGVVDEAPGLVAACRAANAGALDATRLAGCAVTLPFGDEGGALTLLTGISRPNRWPEIRPAALERVLEVARLLADVVLVDCGFGLEEDEELSYDTLAPQRNGATLTAVTAADAVLAVGSADPVGLTRLIPGLGGLRDVLQAAGAAPDLHVVANRVRSDGRSRREVAVAVERHGGVTPVGLVPLDVSTADRVLDESRPACAVAPRSPLAVAVDSLAAALVPDPAAGRPTTSASRWRSGRR